MNDVKANSVNALGNAAASSRVSDSPPKESASRPDQAVSEAVEKTAQVREEIAVETEQQALELSEAVTQLNEYVQNVQRDLQFRLDNDSGKTIITVIDSLTSEVVRQIPDEVAIKLAQGLQQDEPLSLFNAKI